MTSDEFNEKYKDYLEEGHYGLSIDHPKVIEYLDNKFQEFIKYPNFTFSQIKTKFGMVRFYSSLPFEESCEVEKGISYRINN